MLLVGYGTCVNATTTPECTTETNPEGVPKGQKDWKLKDTCGGTCRDGGYFYFPRGLNDE